MLHYLTHKTTRQIPENLIQLVDTTWVHSVKNNVWNTKEYSLFLSFSKHTEVTSNWSMLDGYALLTRNYHGLQGLKSHSNSITVQENFDNPCHDKGPKIGTSMYLFTTGKKSKKSATLAPFQIF